jgi:hypothetical protein
MKLTSDPARTAARQRALDEYMSVNVLAEEFRCCLYGQCKDSHSGTFYEGQLHHLGRHYDLLYDDSPLRVIVVGQEYGHPPARVDAQTRYNRIMRSGLESRFKAEAGREARNPHMRGTTNVLRLLFDLDLAADYDSEFLPINGERVHIFDAFGLVNYLLCSAVGTDGSKRGRATRTMRSNCQAHFREVMRILDPSVLVVQGKSFWKSINGAFACGNLHNREEIIALLQALPVIAKVEDDEALLFMERHRLMGRGVGLVDVHIIASCRIESCLLWTRDRRLHSIAQEMEIEFS